VEFGEEVGLWMKNHSQFDANNTRTWVLTVTEGMLLNEIKRDRQLRDYSVIVIDEVHERSSQDELIMGHLGEVSLQGLRRLFMPSDR
jgi:HrpA-like RNA helicase